MSSALSATSFFSAGLPVPQASTPTVAPASSPEAPGASTTPAQPPARLADPAAPPAAPTATPAPPADPAGSAPAATFSDVLKGQMARGTGLPASLGGAGEAKDQQARDASTGAGTDGSDALAAALMAGLQAPPPIAFALPQAHSRGASGVGVAVEGTGTRLADAAALATPSRSEPMGPGLPGPEVFAALAKLAADGASALDRPASAAGSTAENSSGAGLGAVGAPVALPVAAPPPEVRAPAPAPSAVVAGTVGSNAWEGAVGQRLLWMAGEGHQVAHFRLDPPHLGPLEVRVSLRNDQANVTFLSAHAPVREALQASLPRLSELFAQGGLNLGSVSVGFQQAGGQAGQDTRRDRSAFSLGSVAGVAATLADGTVAAAQPWRSVSLSAVDLFV